MRESIGWRLGFATGAILALWILLIRRFIPREPALAAHARARRRGRGREVGRRLPEPEHAPLTIEQRLFVIPFAVGNFLGPLVLGPLFDTIGRKAMISCTYITSGVLLIVTSQLFVHHLVTATTMTICWSVIFFASAGASAAYLSVSELFPMEVRAMAIALFYAVGTGFAILSPTLFRAPIATKGRTNVDYGYLLGAGRMIGAGVVALFLAAKAERRSLEDIARPLTALHERLAHRQAAPAAAR